MKSSDSHESMVFFVFVVLASMVFGPMAHGWAGSILWSWFVVPVFGLPGLSVAQACGLAITVRLLAASSSNSSDDKNRSVSEQTWRTVGIVFFAPLLSLLFGAVVKEFL